MTQTEKIPIWLDCDPGQDDTVAIILACYCKYFDLLGISTVHGNVSLKNTTCNTLRVLTAIGKTDIKVFPGEEKPLADYKEVFAADVHGKTGLNGSNLLPKAEMEPEKKGAFYEHLAKLIENNPGKINIVATGSLTNIAIFFDKYPELKSKINWISIMGGGFKEANITDNAEFNFYCDPLAAKKIIDDETLSSKMILASLDITSKVFVSNEIQQDVLDGKSKEEASNFRAMMFELIDSFNQRMIAKNLPNYEGPVIHDPVALIILLQFFNVTNELSFTYERRKFTVGIEPGIYGSVISSKPDKDGIYVLTDLNVDNFWKLVLNVYKETDKFAYMNKIPRSELIDESIEGDCDCSKLELD